MSDQGEPKQRRSYIDRLLNYKRYIDFLIERELRAIDKRRKFREASDE